MILVFQSPLGPLASLFVILKIRKEDTQKALLPEGILFSYFKYLLVL